MKVLVTGVSRGQMMPQKAGKPRRFYVEESLPTALERAGHEVDWRRVTLGEDLHEYDACWVTLSPPASFNACYGLGAMWTLARAAEAGIPTVLFLDDWQYTQMKNQVRQIGRLGWKQLRKVVNATGKPMYKEPVELVEQYGQKIIDVCVDFEDPTSRFWQSSVAAVPRFPGIGSLDPLLSRLPFVSELISLDTTWTAAEAIATVPELPTPERQRRYILATLVNHRYWTDKQPIPWEIDWFGPKSVSTQRLVNETAVILKTTEYWGAIAPRYSISAGSGWMRPRFIFAALAGAVTYASEEDAATLGEAYVLGRNDVFLKSASDAMLEELAGYQRDVIMSLVDWDGSRMSRSVDDAQQRAAQKARSA